MYIGFVLLVTMSTSNASISSIPVELQYAIAKCCSLDYTAVFNLLCLMPGLKTYVEGYKHLKQELTQCFLESKEKHKDGYKICYFVKGGIMTGDYKKWNGKGALIKHSHYKNNKKEGECKRWYENGQLDSHCFYKNHKIDGEYKKWNSDGQLFLHCFYKNGNVNGEYKSWYRDGLLSEHSHYKNNKKEGEYK